MWAVCLAIQQLDYQNHFFGADWIKMQWSFRETIETAFHFDVHITASFIGNRNEKTV
jgi:hypothetical protein